MGEAESKKEIFDVSIRTVLFLCLALLVQIIAIKKGTEGVNPFFIINISSDVICMLVGYVLIIGLYMDRQKIGTTTRYLAGLVLSAYAALFSDAIAWIVQDEPDYITINYATNTVYYIAVIFEAIYFWKYTLTYLKVKNRRINIMNKLLNVGFAISLLLIFLNLHFGFYFTVNSNGTYIRSPLCELSMVYSFLAIILSLTIVIIERKQLQPLQIVAFFLYASGPIMVSVVSIFLFGLSLNPSASMMSILLMYCALNVTEGDKKAIQDNEVNIASRMQENILPKAFPYLPERKEFDIYAIMKPAKEVGGDFYDFFMVDDSHLALVIADVSGKGIPAALFMMTSRTLIKNRVQAGDDLAKAMGEINNQLIEGNGADLFITVWIGVIDLNTGWVKAVNAGHEYPAIRKANGDYQIIKDKHSLAVAMFEDVTFDVIEFQMQPGDSIFVYTDGVTESMDENDNLFGKERLIQALNRHPDCNPKEAIDSVLNAIAVFVDGAKQFDDTTMLCVTYFGVE